jgi:hypothetical protein
MSHPSSLKRVKELARKERRSEKEAERERRKREKTERGDAPAGEDPDIAGIVPGPQPQPPEES